MLVVVAILLMVVLLLLVLAVDVGRLFIERGRLRRAAQAAADAGVAVVAEQMVTLAIPRQTEAAARPACVPDADFGTPGASCTATPSPRRAEHWLTDDDRASLVAPAIQTQAAAEAFDYAQRNGVGDLSVTYPFDYDPAGTGLRMLTEIETRLVVLFAGWLGKDSIEVPAQGLSEIPQR
jgi:hypothetical protein